MFIDTIEIYVRSGKGGDGMVHFRREKYVPRGGPDGGDGGKGGDIVFEVKPTLNTLNNFRQKEKYIADDGVNGKTKNMYGRNAEDLIIFIPPGTVIFDASTGETLGDLTQHGQRLIVCKGGRGGRGNTHFKSSIHQTPRVAEKGEPGEEKTLRLELKLIADVGIIGVPNAGKSTLLSVLTNAKPKIAPYPFTTIEPNLGVARVDDDTSVVLADIPGLIEGASTGAGLGHDFLRHIQRTRVLIHLLDGLSEDPFADFSQINSELALFDPMLSKKPQIVAMNKIDQPEAQERWDKLKKQLAKKGHAAISVSAMARTSVDDLLKRAAAKLAETPAMEDAPVPMPVYRPEADASQFTITKEGNGMWRIAGAAIERSASMTYWEHSGSLRRFQRLMETMKIDEALRKAGIENGDTVMIGDYELEWQD
jgi:GTP-binding protein